MCWDEILSGIIIGGAGGASAGIILWAFEWVREQYHKKIVYAWMKRHVKDQDGSRWFSTKIIASYTNLPQDRVKYICGYHDKICESTGKKNDMWGLWGLSRKKEPFI